MQRTKERGITLIVLAITVIVMLILAGVVLNYALGEGGLIGRAEDASNRYQKAEENELAYLNRVEQKYDSILNRVGGGDIEEIPLPSPSDNPNPTTSPSPSISPSPTTPAGPTVEDSKGEKFEDTTTITDKNGEEVTIPGGFTVSPDSSDDVNGGIVVVDEHGNEFVWVPVPDPTTMYIEESTTLAVASVTTNRYSKLRPQIASTADKPGSTNTTPGYREPEVLIDKTSGDYNTTDTTKGITQIKNVLGITGGTDSEILINFGKSMVEEYNAMINSVIKYKGFYIGRYELTGIMNSPTSKKGTALCNINWYALKKACNNLINNDYVQSAMIYGCQWDEVMDWIIRSGAKSSAEVKENASSWGNYSSKQIVTGSNEQYRVNNIYDLAGNCKEWTQEAYYSKKRVYRGGSYSVAGNDYKAYNHSTSYYPSDTNDRLTTRPTLIIK